MNGPIKTPVWLSCPSSTLADEYPLKVDQGILTYRGLNGSSGFCGGGFWIFLR